MKLHLSSLLRLKISGRHLLQLLLLCKGEREETHPGRAGEWSEPVSVAWQNKFSRAKN